MMRNKITSKLIRNFTLIFILFGGVVLLLFTSLFEQYIKAYHEEDLLSKAEFISKQFTYTLEEISSIKPMSEDSRLEVYKRYFRNREGESENLWLVSKTGPSIVMDKPLPSSHTREIMKTVEVPLKKTMEHKRYIGEDFSRYMKVPTISVGVPIMTDGEVVGVAIFHNPIAKLPPTLQKGKEMLLISLVLSTLFAALAIGYIARRFTSPIKKMNEVALQLAKGDYDVKTKVYQQDEIGQLANSMDLLSEKLAESSRESAKLEKLRQDFIVNISHELRTPVTVIRGSLEALRDGIIPQEQTMNYYDNLFNQSIHLQRLVNDLLELSRLQNVDFDIRKEPLNLVDVLDDVKRSMEGVAQKKSISIQLVKEVNPYMMEGDYVRLKQMLMNIVDNAIKFSSTGEKIILRLWIEKDQVKVSVKDFGQGMSSQEVEHIFDRFYKKDENNPTGVGLGLSIVHAIARRHGFHVRVQAKEGEGTEFVFSKPTSPSFQ